MPSLFAAYCPSCRAKHDFMLRNSLPVHQAPSCPGCGLGRNLWMVLDPKELVNLSSTLPPPEEKTQTEGTD